MRAVAVAAGCKHLKMAQAMKAKTSAKMAAVSIKMPSRAPQLLLLRPLLLPSSEPGTIGRIEMELVG